MAPSVTAGPGRTAAGEQDGGLGVCSLFCSAGPRGQGRFAGPAARSPEKDPERPRSSGRGGVTRRASGPPPSHTPPPTSPAWGKMWEKKCPSRAPKK